MVKLKAGEKKKLLITDVCKKLFYRKGYANTTYDDICKKADIPPGSITYHFNGKRDIAAAIDAEYEAQNKIYIEKICGDRYDKTTLMVIENFHMWKRNCENENIRRFLLDISTERLPSFSALKTVKYYYQCVIDDQGITDITEHDLNLIVPVQLGMSDALILASSADPDEYTWEELATFGIRFFLRQIGLEDDYIAELTRRGKEIFDTLPIDNRYYADFAYNDKYVTPLE
ncbi:MAG: TetR/AcrR family transcriptional regulator [Eggerthellaceae bacterium]|nr:TetR/AcrR family transcriptional regulator [Eggerthellaceae bacterium]